MYNLYVKQHNKTELKYLGYTKYNPFTYKGSGLHWVRHIKQHGNNVTTYLIGQYETKEKLKEAGLYYSEMWNVVRSKGWANLTEEVGDGGRLYQEFGDKNPAKRPEVREKIRQAAIGRLRPDVAERNSNLFKGKPSLFVGKHHSEESKQKMRESAKGNKYCLGRKISDETKKKIGQASGAARLGKKRGSYKKAA